MLGKVAKHHFVLDDSMQASVLVLDFGSQYTQLIARRIRELGVFTEILPCFAPIPRDRERIRAVVFSGGPASVTDQDAPRCDSGWLELGVPILGICYGMQLLAEAGGGVLGRGSNREYGPATLTIKDNAKLFAGFERDERTPVWMSHGDHVEKLPSSARLIADTDAGIVGAFADDERAWFGLQFHPEVFHTPRGPEMLSNFLFDIGGCNQDWNPKGFVESTIKNIQAKLGSADQVVCGLSGGVDSTVAATLVHRAIGDRLHCIFVDNGLLRKDEAAEVERLLGPEGLNLPIKTVDAGSEFLAALEGVVDPEQKRKEIGRVFIEVFEREAGLLSDVTHLVQGTLYPDVIESVSVRGPSATIKTHHNVGGLPERMKLKLLEPLRELFKDEVRRVGREMGLPDQVLMRQPFPGPGLAVRVLGPITKARLDMYREADHIFYEEVAAAGLYEQLWQSFAVLLPVKSVGVMGDQRTYQEAIALRAVTSEDGMTADWSYLPEELLRRVSNRIINEVSGVNRVTLDISSKPPATIEWE